MTGNAEPRAALLGVSKPGIVQMRRLAGCLPGARVLVAEEHVALVGGLANEIEVYQGALSRQIPGLIAGFDQLVFFLSVGAVVRLIAPHLGSKYADPGVLAIDSAARFVVPVLSGHVGGANAYAQRIAALLGATAVVTTASDVTDTIAVDVLGRELGWRVEAPKESLTRVAAQVINGEPIAFVQETGSKAWWRGPGPLPDSIHLFERLDDVDLEHYRGVLLVTHRELPATLRQQLAGRLVVYRPPSDEP